MSVERLAEIRERAEAATEGPWSVCKTGGGTYVTRPDLLAVAREWSLFWEPGDAEFIAHARQDVPDLLAEVERLRGEVQRLESSKLLAASLAAEAYCGEEVDRLREQVETLQAERAGGVRWYVPAYRSLFGWVGPIGVETVVREHAEKQAARLRSSDNETEVFVATRLHLPWLPAAEEGPTP